MVVDGNLVSQREVNLEEDIENAANTEIDGLEDSNEVLDYIKEIYVTEYNKMNEDAITKGDIEFWKDLQQEVYKDEAENGDTIVRMGHIDGKQNLNGIRDMGVIRAVKLGEFDENGNRDKRCIERVYCYDDNYVNVYGNDEFVEKSEDCVLMKIGDIISDGIDYYGAFTDDTFNKVYEKQENLIYKDRLKEDIKEYKLQKIEELRTAKIISNNEQKENDVKGRE